MKKLFNLTKLILPFLFIVFSCFFIGCDPTPVPAEHEHNFSKNGDCYGCDATVTFDKGLMYFLVDDYYEVSYDKYSDYKELTIPSSFNGIPVKKIPEEAFYNCNITSIVFEDGLTEIGSLAFSNTKITRLDLPDSLISIDNNAIDGCLELSSISIGKNLLSFGSGYNNLPKVSTITVDEQNPVYKSIDGNLYSKDGTIFYDYVNGKSNATFTLPNTVLEIRDYAFYAELELTEIVLPNGLKNIGDYAFSYCEYLNNINIPDSVTVLGRAVFSHCLRLETAKLPSTITSLEEKSFENCDSLTNINLPNCLLTIGASAFYSCEKLTNVVIPNSVIKIGWLAFFKCESLTNVTIPKSVKIIEASCFSTCTNLSQIIISDGVQIIEEEAFDYCNKLTELIIPISVRSIHYLAFPDTLERIYYAGSEEQWNVIFQKSDNVEITLPTIYYNYVN